MERVLEHASAPRGLKEALRRLSYDEPESEPELEPEAEPEPELDEAPWTSLCSMLQLDASCLQEPGSSAQLESHREHSPSRTQPVAITVVKDEIQGMAAYLDAATTALARHKRIGGRRVASWRPVFDSIVLRWTFAVWARSATRPILLRQIATRSVQRLGNRSVTEMMRGWFSFTHDIQRKREHAATISRVEAGLRDKLDEQITTHTNARRELEASMAAATTEHEAAVTAQREELVAFRSQAAQ
eukprot:SAG25_NODE_3189_length_1179_cov_269.912963_1_plen_243_part_10